MMTAVDLGQEPRPTLVGERVNSQGSRKAKELLLADDYDGERQRLHDQGFEIATELRADGATAVYFDTREAIGAYTEIHSTPERIMTTFERWKAAHHEWDGVTEPLRGRLPPA